MVFEHQEENGWRLHPMQGNTGQAYMGVKDEQKLFLKRNTSPFTAALSIKGITPRLVWTKRMGNGDILTAQEWLNGRILTHEEMNSEKVAKVLGRIHYSDRLLQMLKKVGGQTVYPHQFLKEYRLKLPYELKEHPLLEETFAYLYKHQPQTKDSEFTVCHGDITRQNWLISDYGKLYLVDWDGAVVADPAFDVGVLLHRYVPRAEWQQWLKNYGAELTEDLEARMMWYAKMDLLLAINTCCRKQKYHQMNKYLKQLKAI